MESIAVGDFVRTDGTAEVGTVVFIDDNRTAYVISPREGRQPDINHYLLGNLTIAENPPAPENK